jgi:hypothetical protein
MALPRIAASRAGLIASDEGAACGLEASCSARIARELAVIM